MRINKMLVILLLFIHLTSSCQNVTTNPEIEVLAEWNKLYISKKSFFNKELTHHFPLTLDEKNITFSENFSPKMGALELIVVDSVNKKKLFYEINKYNALSIGVYNPDDTCLLIVDRFLKPESFYKVKLTDNEKWLIDRPCYIGAYPIPNFWHFDFTDISTECKLPKDFIVYVLGAKKGAFMEKHLLTNGWFMPIDWKNGYSFGVAISLKSKIIIYWLVIW